MFSLISTHLSVEELGIMKLEVGEKQVWIGLGMGPLFVVTLKNPWWLSYSFNVTHEDVSHLHLIFSSFNTTATNHSSRLFIYSKGIFILYDG